MDEFVLCDMWNNDDDWFWENVADTIWSVKDYSSSGPEIAEMFAFSCPQR